MTVKANVIFPHDNGLVEDQVVNGWHFDPLGGLPGDFPDVVNMLKDFYTKPRTGGQFIANNMPGHLASTALVVMYDLEQEKPRAPIFEGSFALNNSAGSTLPTEVALCMSFEAAHESGELQARRRNRVYLGPFTNGVLNSGAVSSTFLSTVLEAGVALLSASGTSVTWNWVAYSQTDSISHPINKIWVDNAWDTQRRRGLKATTRASYTKP